MNAFSLLYPNWMSFTRSLKKSSSKFLISMGFAAITTCIILFYALYRFLEYVSRAPMLGTVIGPLIGGLLVAKLLEMLYLAFFIMIVFSSVIASFSTFYLNEEIALLMASPISAARIFWSRCIQMIIESTWMVAVFFFPIFLAFAKAAAAPLWAYTIYPIYLAVFLLSPNILGALIALVSAVFFPIRQIRKIFQFLSVLVIAAMIFFLRYMEPEKLLNPNYFANVSNYILNLQTPLTKIGPSAWITSATQTLFYGDPLESLKNLLPLIIFVIVGFIVLHILACLYYRHSWQVSLEAIENQVLSLEWLRKLMIWPFRFAKPDFRVIVEKEITVFFRDPAVFSQIFMMIAILFVYGYNLTILPLQELPSLYSGEINDTIVYLNGPFIGFILAALAMRFVYPSISMEGKAFWTIKASPTPPGRLVQIKFNFYLVPMVLLGLIMCGISNRIFTVTNVYLLSISFINVTLMAIVITALAVSLGTIYAKFNSDNPLKVSASFGGFVFMIDCALYVMNILALEVYPMFRLYFYRYYPIRNTGSRILIVISFILIFLCSAVWTTAFLKKARDKIERYEPD